MSEATNQHSVASATPDPWTYVKPHLVLSLLYTSLSKVIDYPSRTKRFVKLWCKKTVSRSFEDDMSCMKPRGVVDSLRSSAYEIVLQDKERLFQSFVG